jgi:Putative metal-binding motif
MGTRSLIRFSLSAVLWPFLVCAAAVASPAPRPAPWAGPPLLDRVDYLQPPTPGSRAGATRKALGASESGGERVEYISMQGNRHLLTRFRGLHVEVLLPDSWMGDGKLTEPLVQEFLDRADLLYEHYRELAGEEPGPTDRRLPIAVVAPTCGFGCGFVGAKGTEILDYDVALAHVRDALAAGHTPPVVIHEMGHNFDLSSGLTRAWGDSAHAWNTFVDRYMPVYSRTGTQDAGPDETLQAAVDATFGAYFAEASLTWTSCFTGGGCDAAARNRAWAGTLWRLAELHGAGAVKGYLAFLRDLRATGPWPSTLEQKNDVHVEAMAAGAGLDLGCYADAWRWRATAAVRARMASRYGGQNPFCEDLDGDGASPAAGDCDDTDPGQHLGLAEVADGLDNDCSRRVDDLLAVEPAGGDFAARQALSYPAHARGRITAGDSDLFTFNLTSPRRVRVELCSRPDFQGWLFIYDRNGGWLGFQGVGRGECSSQAWTLAEAREWVFSVDLNVNSMPGGYEVAIYDAEPWPVPPWAEIEACKLCGDDMMLSAAALDLPDGASHVRFWVDGTGWVATVPASPWTSFRWTPPAGFDVTGRTFRAQVLAGEAPGSNVTPPAPLDACVTPCFLSGFLE